jgi:hypothetical protein
MSDERPLVPPRDPSETLDALAPYASTGGHNQYSCEGQAIQNANLWGGLLRNRHWHNRALGWVLVFVFLGVTIGVGLWRLVALFT